MKTIYYVIKTKLINDVTAYNRYSRFTDKKKALDFLERMNNEYKENPQIFDSYIFITRQENVIYDRNGYVARDKNGNLNFFFSEPHQCGYYDFDTQTYEDNDFWTVNGNYPDGLAMAEDDAFKELKWNDDPLKVTLTISLD